MSETIRKNFVFNENVARHLEELSKERKQTMTSLIEAMIEKEYRSIKVKKRLEAFEKSKKLAKKIGTGLFVGRSIQSIKAEMDV